MRIILNFNEYVSNELMVKASKVNTYEEFTTIANEYGWNEALTAFKQTHDKFNEDEVVNMLEDTFYTELIQYVIENTLEAEREPKEETALKVLLDKIRSNKQ